jgi:Holliday junction DNA helicase RuvA
MIHLVTARGVPMSCPAQAAETGAGRGGSSIPVMYDFLRGTVASVEVAGRLSLEVGGVGYSLRVSEQTRRAIPLDGQPVLIYVRLQVKEDDLVLFGFSDVAERAAFDLLLSVQQVGPAMAMAILSTLGVGDLRAALVARAASVLRQVKGVGEKSAERIVLELADKVDRIPAALATATAGRSGAGVQAVEEASRGLIVLGFAPREVASALQQVTRPGLGAEELLRAALAVLR